MSEIPFQKLVLFIHLVFSNQSSNYTENVMVKWTHTKVHVQIGSI